MSRKCINILGLTGISCFLKNKKHRTACLIFVFILTSIFGSLALAYVPTNRDTRMPPPEMAYEKIKTDGFELLGQFGDLAYYFRSDRDIILIKDVKTEYAWKTGLDTPFSQDMYRLIEEAETMEEKLKIAAEPREERLNATYIGLANSLLTVEFFDDSYNKNYISSAARKDASSDLIKISDSHFRLDARFDELDLQISVHIHFSERGVNYRLFDNEITGRGANILSAVIFTPFLGAAGGVRGYYDFEEEDFAPGTAVPMTPAYAFVPDGSGALIRYQDNTVSLNPYIGTVYGNNPAESMYYYDNTMYNVPKKEPLMPVFGVAFGHNQQGFVAWADEGGEHMEIIMSPKENLTNYNFIYPKFIYNRQIHQVYNRKGEGFFRLFSERLHYDISMEYRFLEGREASYVGMALEYRSHLFENGTLTAGKAEQDGIIPLRTDFIMSDVKKSVIGHSNVVTTTAKEAGEIVRDLIQNGIPSINGGLLGFQDGGVTTGKPWTIDYTRAIGSKGDFKKLFEETRALGADLSFYQDYSTINAVQMNLPRNQAYHINRWGIRAMDNIDYFLPVQRISFARPQRSADWFIQQTKKAAEIGALSVSVSGMTNRLISHYGRNDEISASETIELYEKTFAGSPMVINAKTPNQYLWKHTDRFLETPVLPTQYILQTDTVPFLQLVLHGTMELYAPYANFSFYTQRDILRMIDYNVYPSFLLTHEPAHLLTSTNSLKYYSTEYNLYKDIILQVHTKVSEALSEVKGREWLDRTVFRDGVIVNTYSGGIEILINYTDEAYTYGGVTAGAQSAAVIHTKTGSGDI